MRSGASETGGRDRAAGRAGPWRVAAALAATLAGGVAEGASLELVQRGSTTLGLGSAFTTVTLSKAVDTAEAFLVFGIAGSDNSPDDIQISGQITNATTLTFARAGTTAAVDILWYVSEFDSGVAVQRGAAVLPDAINPADLDVAITAVDLAKTFPLLSFRTTGTDFDSGDIVRAVVVENGVNDGGTPCATATTHCLRLTAADAAAGAVVEWQVVEHQDVIVQTGTTLFFGPVQTVTPAITSIDTTKSWLTFSYECVPAFCNGDLPNIGSKMVRGSIQDATTLEFNRDNGGPFGEVILLTWYLVEFTDATTVRHGEEPFGLASATETAALIPAVEPATSIAAGGGYQRGMSTDFNADDDPGVGWATFDVTDSTTIEMVRGATGGAAQAGWFVVDFGGVATSGHHLIYSTNDFAPATPRVRTMATIAPTWEPEASTVAATTDINWIVAGEAPTRDEEISVVFSDAPRIDVQRWNGTAWSAEWSSTAGLVAADATRRGIAVAYEQTSGDAIVVYTNASANPQFRTWNGAAWSAPANVFTAAPGSGAVRWVELASDPGSNRIALVYSDANQDVHAALWNGATWDQTTAQTLTTTGANALEYRDVDAAFESSGDLMVVHAQGDGFDYWTMAAATTTWVDGGHVSLVTGSVAHVDVAAESGTDRIALVGIDENAGTERLGAATWTGAGWFNAGEYVTGVPHWETDGPGTFWAAVEWLGTGGEAVIAFSDITAGELGWARWTDTGTGWVVQPDVIIPGSSSFVRSVQLEVLPGFDRIIAAFSDAAGDIRTAGYGAGGWTVGGVLNGGLTSADLKPFALSMSSLSLTAVDLLAFDAVGLDGAVELTWETVSEVDNLGFHVYRGDAATGPWQRVTATLIPGLGSSAEGARYGYRDAGLENGRELFYLLEDVEGSGRTERHGPVAATPGTAGPPPGDDGQEPGPGPKPEVEPESADVDGAWLAYGNPEANALRIVRRGPRRVDIELETHGFYALPRRDGTVRLWVPGFEDLSDPGAPRVPVRRTWIEALAGRGVKLRGAKVRDVESFSGLRPADSGEPVLVTLQDGTQRMAERPAQLFRRGRSLVPETPARLLGVGFLGHEKRAWIELAPLRWDPVSGQLLLAKRLVLRVAFAGRVPEEQSLGGSNGRRPGPLQRRDGVVLARLATREAGLHAVAFEDVFPGRRRSARASWLVLSRRGEPVAFHLEPRADRFGPGSRLYFLSEGGATATHGNEAVYELSLGRGGVRMDMGSAAPRGGEIGYGFATRRFEEQRRYLNGLTAAPVEDLWFWEMAVAPGTRSFDFALDAVTAMAPARLRVELQGAADAQHARLRLNDRPVAELEWTGREGRVLEAELPPGLLLDGVNRLDLEAVPVPGRPSAVWMDAFEVEYPRRVEAAGGRLEARFEVAGTAAASGLGAGSHVVDTSAAPVWLEGAAWTAGTLRFGVGAGRQLLAVAPESVLRPEVRPATPNGLRTGGEGADYVAIGPRAFLEAAAPLLWHRRAQGLRVAAVAIEDVTDEFGHGEPGPSALRDFLSWAYHEWPQPSPRYVLLLGDTTYDVKDYLGAPARDHVPAWMVRAAGLWTLSDPVFGAVNGEDLLPDVAVGRLPASDVEEARLLAEKVVAFERGGYRFSDGPVVLVADNSDRGGDFEGDVDAIAHALAGYRDVETLSVRELGRDGTRTSIRAAFDGGAAAMSYFGHGAIALWASENVWNSGDPATLAVQPRQPLVLAVNCLNGYILNPYVDSLGEALVKPEGRGAIASFTASALSLHSAARVLHDALLGQALFGRHERLGDVLLASQRAFADAGGSPETLGIYLLLGDPALRLR